MWSIITAFISKLLKGLLPLLIAKKWGEDDAKKEQLEADAKARERDEKIASRSYVRFPFRMRRKQK